MSSYRMTCSMVVPRIVFDWNHLWHGQKLCCQYLRDDGHPWD